MSLFEIGNYVIIDDTYMGKIVKKIWNGYGLIVKLDNEQNYVDNTILQYHLINDITNDLDIKGFMLVKSTNKVRLVNKHNLGNLIKSDLNKDKFIFIENKINKNLIFFKSNILPTVQTSIMSSVPVIPSKLPQKIDTTTKTTVDTVSTTGIGSLLGMGFRALGGGNKNNETNIKKQLNKLNQYVKTNNLSEYIIQPNNIITNTNLETQFNREVKSNNIQNIIGGVYNPYINNVISNSAQNIPQLVNTYQFGSSKKESLDKVHKILGVKDAPSPDMSESHITLPVHQNISSSSMSDKDGKIDTEDDILESHNENEDLSLKDDQIADFREQDKAEDNYELYIKNMIGDLFKGDDEIDYEETFNDGKIYMGVAEQIGIVKEGEKDDKIKPTIKAVLEQFKKINKKMYLDLTNTLLYKHIITDNKLDTISFGKELILRIKGCLTGIQSKIRFEDNRPTSESINLFDYLKFQISRGYIVIDDITKEHLNLRTITRELVPNLKLLEKQYDNPIDYKILSNIILENKTTLSLQKNKDIIMESLNILAQEYIICLQPRVEYLLWTLTRLILCWYSDPILNENIVKIKVLINLYRARGIKDFNKEIGVQPVIKIIPKYGREPSLKILSYLSYYFFPYKNVGWKGSSPSYFNKVDDLIYYTNGSIDLKRYIKHLLKTGNTIINPISSDLTKIKLKDNTNEIEYRLPISKK